METSSQLIAISRHPERKTRCRAVCRIEPWCSRSRWSRSGFCFEQLVTLLLMVVIAVIVSLPVTAGADWLGRFRVPRVLGVLLTLLLGGAILWAVLALVVPAFIHQAKEFANEFPRLLTRAEHALGLTAGTVVARRNRIGRHVTFPSHGRHFGKDPAYYSPTRDVGRATASPHMADGNTTTLDAKDQPVNRDTEEVVAATKRSPAASMRGQWPGERDNRTALRGECARAGLQTHA